MSVFSYEGRRVVVTGGARGVGAALLDVLAELDAAHVTVIDLNAAERPARRVPRRPTSPTNERSRASIASIDGPVDALFNNAGVADTQPPRTVFSVNYLALRTLSEGLLDRMPEGGAIVNTASTGRQPVAQAHVAQINDAARPRRQRRLGSRRCDGSTARPADARPDAVQLLEGARRGVHDALVARDDAARRAHERRVPRADRHAAAARVPRDDERQDRRLEHPRDGGPGDQPARGRDGAGVPRLAGRRATSTA